MISPIFSSHPNDATERERELILPSTDSKKQRARSSETRLRFQVRLSEREDGVGLDLSLPGYKKDYLTFSNWVCVSLVRLKSII